MTLGINLMRYRRRRHEEESRDVYALVEHIIGKLVCRHHAHIRPQVPICTQVYPGPLD